MSQQSQFVPEASFDAHDVPMGDDPWDADELDAYVLEQQALVTPVEATMLKIQATRSELGHADGLVVMLLGALALALLAWPTLEAMGFNVKPSLDWIQFDPEAVANLKQAVQMLIH